MSGFEVAGLVLAIVPIVVEALKAYNESKKFYDRFRNKTALIADLMLDLDYYRWSINEQVAKVLTGAGVDVSEAELRDGSAARKLQDTLQNEVIIQYLGLERFNQLVRQLVICQGVLTELIGKFEGLLPSSDAPSAGNDSELLRKLLFSNQFSGGGRPWESSGRKLKFSYKKPEIDARLATLKSAVERLKDKDLQVPRDFVCADAVPSEISSRTLATLMRSFEVVRQQAARLYNAIACTLPPSCHHRHTVRLFLDDRTEALQSKKQRSLRRSKAKLFHIELLAFTESNTVDVRHKCDILTEDPDDQDEPVQGGKQPAVSFSLIESEVVAQKVMFFCASIQKATAEQTVVEFRLASHGALCYREDLKLKACQDHINGMTSSLSLEEVIKRAIQPGSPERNWTFTQRMVLALRLSCSLLQLNRTHWLSTSLASSSIFFQDTGTDGRLVAGGRPPFEADMPFVSQSDPPGFFDRQPENRVHPMVLDLGLTLMELWGLTTFSQYCRQRNRDVPTTHQERHEAADAWLNELDPGMPPFYKKAVRRCIEFTSRTSYHFDDGDFRGDFCEGVVKPLWENCQIWLR